MARRGHGQGHGHGHGSANADPPTSEAATGDVQNNKRLLIWCALLTFLSAVVGCAGVVKTPDDAMDPPRPGTGNLEVFVRVKGPITLARHPDGLAVDLATCGLANAIVEVWPAVEESAVPSPKIIFVDWRDRHWSIDPIIARVGQKVRIVNCSRRFHAIRSDDYSGSMFDLNMALSKACEFPLVRSGRVDLNCEIHSGEHLWLYVSEAPHVERTDSLGRCRFVGLPPGDCRIRVMHYTLSPWMGNRAVKERATASLEVGLPEKWGSR